MKKTIPFLRRPAAAPAPAPELDPMPLEDRVQDARDRLAYQHDPALLNALSDRELAANRELAERARAHERREQIAHIESAAKAADRLRDTVNDLADRQAQDLIRAEKAIAEQRHASSPHAKVARLHRRKTLALRIITGVLVASLAISAVSVQHNIAPVGGPANIWWWMAYGIEFLISGTLIALVMSTGDTAEWDVVENPTKAHAIEIVLLAVTVILNTFPYFKNTDWGQIGVHAIAPIIIGTALLTYRVVAGRYGQSIERATAALTTVDHGDLQTRLAALTNIGGAAVPVGEQFALPRPAVHTPQLQFAITPQSGDEHEHAETVTRTMDPQFAPRTAGSHPAVEDVMPDPAVRGAARSTDPQFALEDKSEELIRGEVKPAVAEAPTWGNDVIAGSAVVTQFEVQHPVEPVEETDDEPEESAGSPDALDDVNLQLAERPTAGLRAVEHTSAPQLRPRSSHPAVRGEHGSTPQFTRSGAGSSAPKSAVRTNPMANLAAEIQQRGVGKRKSIDAMTTAVAAIIRGETNNAVAQETGMSHNTVNRIRDVIDEIHAAEGVVIKLRKDSDR